MDDNDKKPVGEGIDEIEDNDDCEDPAESGNQASPSPVQDAPESEEFPSGMSAETSSRSAAENLNNNQLNDIFYSSRHLQIRNNCSQLVDALLSPRQHAILLKGQSGSEMSSVPSSQDQNIDQLEEASSINAPVSNRQRQRVLSMLDTSAGTSSQTSGPTSVSQTTERSGSVLGESRASDCVSPLPSSSARETTQIPQLSRKARKSFSSKSGLPKAITSSRRSFETGIESTSAKKAETERSESDSSESGPRHESFGSKPSPLAAEGTFGDSPINAQARKIRIAAQQDETSEPLSRPKARKSFSSKSSLSKTIHFSSSRRSFETGMEPTSARKAETERSESDSGESGPRHESFRSKPSISAAEGPLCYSRIRSQAREIVTAAQQGDTSVLLTVPLSSREREGTSSGSSECEDSRKPRKTPSSDEHSNEESGNNSTSAAEESSPSAAEGTFCDPPINAQVQEMRIAARQDETSEPHSVPLTSRKRERISGSSSENEDSRKQQKMLPSGDELSNEESSPSTLGDSLYIHPGEASTSGHRPAVSDPRARVRECLSTARKLLSKVFREIEDSGDKTAEIAWNFIHEISDMTVGRLSNILKTYYKEKKSNWNERKESLSGVESEVQETYEIFVRIVVQSLVSILSLPSIRDYYSIMLNYRNFSNFYGNFKSYWEENNMDDMQDEEIRNRERGPIERIRASISDTRKAFRNLLEVVQVLAAEETYMDILETYGKDLLEGDEEFLTQRTR